MRGSRQGESHGGVYLVDFDAQRAVRTVDWNTMNIDWQGRGWDRGLRGIAFDGETVYIAASDELFAFTPDFKPLGSWRNPYLKHAHEIFRHERTLFVTSTGFDSVLGFDLDRREFNWGLHVSAGADGNFTPRSFDPAFHDGPLPSNELHINNVHCERGGMHIAGLRTHGVLLFNGRDSAVAGSRSRKARTMRVPSRVAYFSTTRVPMSCAACVVTERRYSPCRSSRRSRSRTSTSTTRARRARDSAAGCV